MAPDNLYGDESLLLRDDAQRTHTSPLLDNIFKHKSQKM